MTNARTLGLAAAFLSMLPSITLAQDPDAAPAFAPAQLEFFENRIRPVLVQECYQCHSATAKKLQGGLYLDSRQGLLDGGDSGPAVVVDSPDESLLIEALNHESFEMPPDKRLANDVVADFQRWIRDGLADPRQRSQAAEPKRRVLYADEDAESHWAFQPVAATAVPEIDDPWIQTPIDAFILAKLRAAGLEPSRPADRRTLLRRATYDLTGLPPTFDEVRKFEANESTDAFVSVVRDLLQSPRYGEKWARHWLDVARYADTNGQRPAPTPDPPFYPFAWTYRDYVSDAFNRDLPFDQFIVEQIAGDFVVSDDDRRALAGLGFLRVGKSFGQNIDDRIDDRIDTTTKAFLGLTVACARCHDHKLDPIYQDDYYAIHGVLASSEDHDPVADDKSGTDEHADYLQQRRALVAEIEAECLAGLNRFMHGLSMQVAEHMIGVERYRDGKLSEKLPSLAARELNLQPIPFEAWVNAVSRWEKQDTAAYRPWFAFAALEDHDFSERASLIVEKIATGTLDGQPIPRIVAEKFSDQRIESLRDVAEIYQAIFLELERLAGGQYPMAALLCGLQESPPRQFRKEFYHHPALPPSLTDAEHEALRQVTIGFGGPFFMTPREMMQAGAAEPRKAMIRRQHEVFRLEADHPGAPIRVMAVRDRKQTADSPLYIRGDSKTPGPIVPRRFLRRLSDGEPVRFTVGSGRLELAREIASPHNPLTARVIVNRIWQWHFGRGLVTTPSDFGLSGQPPSHPELLDWLTDWFVREGWSIKKLHRLIMSSSVYSQASLPLTEGLAIDAENELLWRFAPRRMAFEEMRDTWLAAAGTLEHRAGGRPADPATARSRSIYLTIDRFELPATLSTFDFPSPDFSTDQRESTTVPQQSLYMMNSPWLIARANELAERREVIDAVKVDAKIRMLYIIVYQRPPDKTEASLAADYLRRFPADQSGIALKRFAHALLQTTELVSVQ